MATEHDSQTPANARDRHITDEDALRYHSDEPPGKLETNATKPLSTQYDLSLAYSPGVAVPTRRMAADSDSSFEYTARGNLIAVISNGSAVLGLGDVGPVASKAVMEGKAVLFKRFAGIDVFDLEIDAADPHEFVRIVRSLQPGFGGINLEDIKAPECFLIERELREQCEIPVMHDDQHGTAIITGAALLNALELAGKSIEEVKLVGIGAGAAGIACLRFFVSLGVSPANIVLCDKDGIVRRGEVPEDDARAEFATARAVGSLSDALDGADALLGLSAANILGEEELRRMAADPIVLALANPDPEVAPRVARAARPDIILATGRSDEPNQVNNVLGFPYIFRGALDVRARGVTENMKLAAARAIAALAREPVPESVNRAYSGDELTFGRDYLIPKPLDPRLLTTVAPAVARAAVEDGVARREIEDWRAYDSELLGRVGIGQKLISSIADRARAQPKRVIFTEADNYTVLKAAEVVSDQGVAVPVLVGDGERIRELIEAHELRGLDGREIRDPDQEAGLRRQCAERLYRRRQRRGLTRDDARGLMRDQTYFGAALLEQGYGDALIAGFSRVYPKVLRPALEVIGPQESDRVVAGMYIINSRHGVYFFADTTVNRDPSVEQLVDIIGLTACTVRLFEIEPVVAVLSYSNFGSNTGDEPQRGREAVDRAKHIYPDLTIDGELQANVAVNPRLLEDNYPFSDLIGKKTNTLIFPNLSSGNIAYKLIQEIGGVEVIGPVLMGMRKPVQILQLGASVREIVNMATLAVVEAQQ